MDAILLYTRIETVRLEVQALRAHQNAPVEATFSPKRIELPPWQSELDRRV
jgi:hypothetical protein